MQEFISGQTQDLPWIAPHMLVVFHQHLPIHNGVADTGGFLNKAASPGW
jgi:hypothetical protein